MALDYGKYYKICAKHSGKCLDIRGGVTSRANGAAVQQYDYLGNDNQQWEFMPVEGLHVILAKNSGKCLDVKGGSAATGNGIDIQQYDYKGTGNQKWELREVGGGAIAIVASHSGKCLDVKGGAAATGNGVDIQQYEYKGTANQNWNISPLGNIVEEGALIQHIPGPVFLIDGGKRRGIPDIETLVALGFTGAAVHFVLETVVTSVPSGQYFPHIPSRLIRNHAGTVFYIEKGRRRGIPSYDTWLALAERYHWAVDEIKEVSDEVVAAISPSNDFPSEQAPPRNFCLRLWRWDFNNPNVPSMVVIARRTVQKHSRAEADAEAKHWKDVSGAAVCTVEDGTCP